MSGMEACHSRNSSSSYMTLLNALASDLDLMLNDLCASQDEDGSSSPALRGDGFLEPYLHGISSDGGKDTSPLLSSSRNRALLSPNQNSAFHIHDNGNTRNALNQAPNGYRDSAPHDNDVSGDSGGGLSGGKSHDFSAQVEAERRRACLDEMDALRLQNKQQLNEMLKLASVRREVVSTDRTGRIIERERRIETDCEHSPLLDSVHLNDNTSEETLSQREDLSGSEGVGSEASDGDDSDSDSPCDIALMERLIRSHPVWFLPGIQRTGAVHLLQGKEQGNFVVRQSSQPDTMAISVRLPEGKGPYIEHYLIQAHGNNLSLESSENMFDSIPNLICHYCQCCDELPVQLTLPKTIRDAKNRQQLSSFALLGQEFWRYPMAHPKTDQQSANTSPSGSLCSFPSVFNRSDNMDDKKNSIILNLSPIQSPTLSTFKAPPDVIDRPARPNTLQIASSSLQNSSVFLSDGSVRSPPLSAKTPPQPPPRWAKPSPSASPPGSHMSVTTTVTFNMQQMHVRSVEVTPTCSAPVVSDSEAEPSMLSSPASEQSLPFPSTASPTDLRSFTQNTSRLHTLVSPISDTTNLVSKGFQKVENNRSLVSTPTEKNGRARKLKRNEKRTSQHYKAFDILRETPNYKGDGKQSDYEDVWAGETLSTFKPDLKKPDLIEKLTRSPVEHKEKRFAFGSMPSMEKEDKMNQTSPFYAEPADSLKTDVVHRGNVNRTSPRSNRHSDPSHFSHWINNSSQFLNSGGVLPRIDSHNEIDETRGSDNMLARPSSAQKRNVRAKAVQPPRVASKTEPSWTVDSSWEFIGQEENECDDVNGRFPSIEQQMDSEHRAAGFVTARHILARRFPHLRLEPTVHFKKRSSPPLMATTGTMLSRISAYDNLEGSRRDAVEDSEDATTSMSEMWDLTRCECGSESTIRVGGDAVLDTEDDETVFGTPKKPRSLQRGKSFKDRLDPLLSAPRIQSLHGKDLTGPGATIRCYALHLGSDKSTTFAQSIDNFIACTLTAKEINPQIVMRNIRQFMSGMKNYLVKHGEKEFEKYVEIERMKLKATEFLNLDTILEEVMHKLVVRPLKAHLYKLFVDEYTKSGAIQLLHENILFARTKPLSELGIRAKIVPPSEAALQSICKYLTALQEVDSPMDKLQFLLACIGVIFNSVAYNDKKTILLGADDFLPLFVWVLVQSGFIEAEIEAEFMWGLLHPSLLSGEGGYYLTTLSSAVHVLKSFKAGQMPLSSTTWSGDETQTVLKVVVPDELHGSILTTTLPIRLNMTTKDVTKILAHKVRITNPQDYGLFKLVDGEETLLGDNESPQVVKSRVMESGKHCMLAYKRIDAKIAWPNT